MSNIIFSIKSIGLCGKNTIVRGKLLAGIVNKYDLVKIIYNSGYSIDTVILDSVVHMTDHEEDYLLIKHEFTKTIIDLEGCWIVDGLNKTLSCLVSLDSFQISNEFIYTGKLFGNKLHPGWQTHIISPNGSYQCHKLMAIEDSNKQRVYTAMRGNNIAIIFSTLPNKHVIQKGSLILWNLDFYEPSTTIIEHSDEFVGCMNEFENIYWYQKLLQFISIYDNSLVLAMQNKTEIIDVEHFNKNLVIKLNSVLSKNRSNSDKDYERWRNILLEHICLQSDSLMDKYFEDNPKVTDDDIIISLCKILNIKLDFVDLTNKTQVHYNLQNNDYNEINWGRILTIGGIFIAKAVCRYFGSDFEADWDLGDIFGGDSSDNENLEGNYIGDSCGGLSYESTSESITNNLAFMGSGAVPSFDTGSDVTVISESGVNKGSFDVFRKGSNKYIKFGTGLRTDWSNWVKLDSDNSFWYNGVRYIFK